MKLSVDQALRKAATLERKGQAGDAEAIYRDLLSRFPANKRAADGLAALAAAGAPGGEVEALVKLLDDGRLPEAAERAAMLLKGGTSDPRIYRVAGMANAQLGRLEMALVNFEAMARLAPDDAEAMHQHGNVLLSLRRLDAAVASYDRALQLQPDLSEAHCNRGNALLGMQRPADALASFEAALRIKPEFPAAWYGRGNVLAGMGRLEDALASFDEAVRYNPDLINAHNNRGVVLKELGRAERALASFGEAIRIDPRRADIHNNCGVILQGLGRLEEAVKSYDTAIALKPDMAEAHKHRGDALRKLERLEAAVAGYDKALRLVPNDADAHHDRGLALKLLGRSADALASFDNALRLNPRSAEFHDNRGAELQVLERSEEALASFEEAIRLQPELASAHNNRGVILKEMGRLDEALASFDEAIRCNSEVAQAYYNRGKLYDTLKRQPEALADFARALHIEPNPPLLGQLLHQKAHLCDWSGDADPVLPGIEGGAVPPFQMISLEDDPRHHLERARKWAATQTPAASVSFARPSQRPAKLRVGYFSADFHDHATMLLLARVFELHDKDRFEFHAFSYGPEGKDDWRQRAIAAFDRFHDVSELSDPEAAQLARDSGIDIAVDLKGYTGESRIGIHASRPAPVQINYLGYPGSLGADYIDYIIADAVIVPPELRQFYSEKVICLPHSYQANDNTRSTSPRQYSRTELGLPEDGFVFCCFNGNYKIRPAEFDIWMRLLTKVEGSVLWLVESNEWAGDNLRREAAKRGVDPSRIVFAPRVAVPAHLARHRCADLFLDTFNCNAHTTASDALWSGLPVVSLIGRSFASRVGASLLEAVGMGELVTRSTEEYEALALALASDPDHLARVRAKLAGNRPTAPLFDTEAAAHKLERAYDLAFDRYLRGLAPDHIDVPDV